MENLLDDRIKARLTTLRILYAALLGSGAMFAFVMTTAPPAEVPEGDIILPVLAFVSLSILVVSFVFPSAMEKKLLGDITVEITTSAAVDENVPSSFAKHSTARVFAKPKEALGRALDATFTPFIMRMALRESIGIYGLVLRFMGHSYAESVPFLVVALITQAAAFPSLSRIADLLEKVKGASLGPRT